MYHGDGSYKQLHCEYELETSLISLLNKEKELVDSYNSSVRALEIAKRNCMRSTGYSDDIIRTKDKLNDIRLELKEYFIDKIGIKTDMQSLLYSEDAICE